MLLRRHLPLAAAALALACAPSVPYSAPPTAVNYAVFDITSATPQIPLPNDLALQASSIAAFPPSAQRDLLNVWASQGGFPNDQEVDITIDFQEQQIDPKTGALTNVAPDLDLTTVTPDTLKIIELPGSSVPYAPITAASYVKSTDRGTLTIKNISGTLVGAPWTSGVHYAVAVRGGDSGVKTTGGVAIQPSPIFYLLTRGVNLALPENETLLPGTRDQKAAAGAQLEQLRQSYLEPFTQVSSYFPSTDLAVMSTFQIAPTTSAYVQTDPNRGLIPLPSDFLLDATGHVQNIPAFGPLAGGLTTLDGFSTTGMVLSTLSAPILGATVNKNTVLLYDLSNPSAPVRVPDATEAGGGYQSEPAAITQTVNVGGTQVAVSTAIGLQPAIPLSTGVMLPPLKEHTEYAVIITTGVKDLNQAGLSRSTLAQLLLFEADHPVAANGKSLVSGVPDSQAVAVQAIRQLLAPALAKFSSDTSEPTSDIAMAYTFKTQSITGVGNITDPTQPYGLLQFAALPYADDTLAKAIITSPVVKHTYSAADAFTKYGIDTSVVPNSHIAAVLDAQVITPDLLSDTTGAFDASGTVNPTPIPAIIVLPNPANVTSTCVGAEPFPGAKCTPLVIFHHGLTSDRAAVLTVADALAAKGFIVAAIDGAKHGARSWCDSSAAYPLNGCNAPGVCTPIAGAAGQGDGTKIPGICATGDAVEPELCATQSCVTNWINWSATHTADPADGHVLLSGNYFVSANFFRTRDTLRQDLIDQSALILALTPPPALVSGLGVTGAQQAVPTAIALSTGLVIDPRYIDWEGQSLGSILGTINAAANSRISNVALNVGGGTLTDIFTNAPSFASNTCALLQSVGVFTAPACAPANASQQAAYLQFLIVAKWILDPADPINAAGHLTGDAAHPMLPDLLNSTPTAPVLQKPKNVLGQMAACDQTVPNPFNLLLYGNIGILDLSKLLSQTPSTGNVTIFNDLANAAGCGAGAGAVSPYAVPHAFITDWGTSESINFSTGAGTFTNDANVAALTGIAQGEAASFLFDPTNLPPSVVAYPIP